jgi:D-arabinose 1-dehydrogenase-like Zn-dependent alcohol dehydrogenase
MVAPVEALVAIPESLSDADAPPLLCAGLATYNSLRHSGALPGDLVAVQGIGGLGQSTMDPLCCIIGDRAVSGR